MLILFKCQSVLTYPTDAEGNTALHFACSHGLAKAIALMISVNPSLDINDVDGFGMTSLMIAASKDHIDVVDVLMKQRQLQVLDQDYRGWSAAHWAASCGSIECLRKFLSINRFNLFTMASAHGETPMHLAAREGNAEVIQEILTRVPLSYKSKILTLTNADGLTPEAVCALFAVFTLLSHQTPCCMQVAVSGGYTSCFPTATPNADSSSGIGSDSGPDKISPGKRAASD